MEWGMWGLHGTTSGKRVYQAPVLRSSRPSCWAMGADSTPSSLRTSIALAPQDSSCVLWLRGTERIQDLGSMGAYYGFNRNQPAVDLASMFITIARDLADPAIGNTIVFIDAFDESGDVATLWPFSPNARPSFRGIPLREQHPECPASSTTVRGTVGRTSRRSNVAWYRNFRSEPAKWHRRAG